MSQEEYIPMEGHTRGPLYSSRLYIGQTHLLKSTIIGPTETFRRFAWKDIQAFTLLQTGLAGVFNLLAGIILVMLIVTFINWRLPLSTSIIFLGTPITVLIFGLIRNIRQGPTCEVRIQTAVSDEKLGSLHRVKTARVAIAQLAEIIRAKQAPPAAPDAAEGIGAVTSVLTFDPKTALLRKLKKPDSGRWHQAALVLVGLGILFNIIELMDDPQNHFWRIFGSTLFFASVALSIAIVAAQANKSSNSWIQGFGWWNFGYNVFSLLYFAFLEILSIAKKARHPNGTVNFRLEDYAFYRPMLYLDTAMVVLLFIFGLIAVLRYRPLRPSVDSAEG